MTKKQATILKLSIFFAPGVVFMLWAVWPISLVWLAVIFALRIWTWVVDVYVEWLRR